MYKQINYTTTLTVPQHMHVHIQREWESRSKFFHKTSGREGPKVNLEISQEWSKKGLECILEMGEALQSQRALAQLAELLTDWSSWGPHTQEWGKNRL